MSTPPPKDSERHPEMKVAAEEAASVLVNVPVSPDARDETYEDITRRTLEAHLLMRKVAFYTTGILSTIYLLCLLCVLWKFFDGELLASVIGASKNEVNWHVLVLIGIGMVIFAAIPLSLIMAVVKMVSGKNEETNDDIKTPAMELGKALYELVKGFVEKSGK